MSLVRQKFNPVKFKFYLFYIKYAKPCSDTCFRQMVSSVFLWLDSSTDWPHRLRRLQRQKMQKSYVFAFEGGEIVCAAYFDNCCCCWCHSVCLSDRLSPTSIWILYRYNLIRILNIGYVYMQIVCHTEKGCVFCVLCSACLRQVHCGRHTSIYALHVRPDCTNGIKKSIYLTKFLTLSHSPINSVCVQCKFFLCRIYNQFGRSQSQGTLYMNAHDTVGDRC